MIWSERVIAHEIARQTLDRRCLVLVDNCNWTGHECDVLGVTMDMRIIDVEVKISRSDLKADAKKDKWWHRTFLRYEPEQEAVENGRWMRRQRAIYDEKALTWPRKVWKHYYAMPSDIWKPELLECLPSKASGVLLLTARPDGRIIVGCKRRATPCRDADRLKPEQVLDIARLANLRMWSSYEDAERARDDADNWRKKATAMEAACSI